MKLKKSVVLILILNSPYCAINAENTNLADVNVASVNVADPDLDYTGLDFEELKARAILAIQQRKAILDKLKGKLDALERNADSVAQDERLFRAITKDLDDMFPGDGEVWKRLDNVIKKVKDLEEEEKFRKKKSYVVGKAFGVSLLTSFLVCLVSGYYFKSNYLDE